MEHRNYTRKIEEHERFLLLDTGHKMLGTGNECEEQIAHLDFHFQKEGIDDGYSIEFDLKTAWNNHGYRNREVI